jgi:hypothetical protein
MPEGSAEGVLLPKQRYYCSEVAAAGGVGVNFHRGRTCTQPSSAGELNLVRCMAELTESILWFVISKTIAAFSEVAAVRGHHPLVSYSDNIKYI